MRLLPYLPLASLVIALGCGESRLIDEPASSAADAGMANLASSPTASFAMPEPVAGGTEARMAPAPESPTSIQQSDIADSSITTIPTMVIRTGNASIEVKSIDEASAQVRQLAQQVGGYIANTSVQSGKNQIRSATLELKIPAARFDSAVAGLNPIGTVESVDIRAEDVSEEFVDVSARLTNARKLEQRLIELLAQRTGKLSDVIEVEQALSRVRQEIERYAGRIRYLKTRASISTLVVTVHEARPILDSIGSNPILDAFKTAWRNFVEFVAGFIALLGVIVPLSVLVFVGWRIVVRMRRTR